MRPTLLCVDVQKGFVRDDASERVANEIVRLAASGDYEAVWATRFLNPGPEGPFHRWMQWYRFAPDDDDATLWPALAALEPRVFAKYTYGPPPSLLEAVDRHEPGGIDLVGLDTEACVLATAIRLFDAGVPPRVVVNATWSGGGEAPWRAGLKAIERTLGPRSLVRR